MDPAQLEQIKTRLAKEFFQSPGGDLDAMLCDIRGVLDRSGLFTDIVTRKTGSREHLINVRCQTASSSISPRQVAEELFRAWQEELRYDDYAAHAIVPTESSITLDFVTATAQARLYVTGLVVVVMEVPSS
jgi:hypothetical protein